MDISKELKEAAERKIKVSNSLQEVRQQEQVLLQELLRIDGEIRILQKLGAGQKDTKSGIIEKEDK